MEGRRNSRVPLIYFDILTVLEMVRNMITFSMRPGVMVADTSDFEPKMIATKTVELCNGCYLGKGTQEMMGIVQYAKISQC